MHLRPEPGPSEMVIKQDLTLTEQKVLSPFDGAPVPDGVYPKELNELLCPHKNLHTMFTAALFVIATTWEQPRPLQLVNRCVSCALARQ